MTKFALELRDIEVSYPRPHKQPLKAVAGVSLSIESGKTLALIGESGSGKSTIARAICGLVPHEAGSITFEGMELGGTSDAAKQMGAAGVQLVSQDSGAALDPRWPAWKIISEPQKLMHRKKKSELKALAANLLESVGLPRHFIDKLPRQLSGGQRQRVNIARALAADARLLVLDEAVSALDISVRNEILTLLDRLRSERGLTYLFITHDMGTVIQLADQVAVLYLGQIVEIGDVHHVVLDPKHPYTNALTAAVPAIGKSKKTILASGEIDDPANPPSGCRFHRRCPFILEICRQQAPEERFLAGRKFACHRADEIDQLNQQGRKL